MPIINLDPARARYSFCGRRKLEPYDKLRRYYTLAQLRDMCKAFGIEHNPKATRSDLAVLIVQHQSNSKL